MEPDGLHLLSTYLKKWSYQENKISVSFSYFTARGYGRNMVEMRINSPQIMVNDFLNGVFYKLKDQNEADENGNVINTRLVNESEVKQKILLYFTKILKEFNTNKKSHGKSRMISNRSMDFYYNDYEYDPLDTTAKYYVHLNRGLNKMNGDLWDAAKEDLGKALEFNPESTEANRFLGQAYIKGENKEQAIPYFERLVELDQKVDSMNELAMAYIKVNDFNSAEKLYKKMSKMEPDNLLAMAGQAQVAYLNSKPYISKLDKIKKIDDLWLREFLKSEWIYNIPGYGDDDTKMWNAATASRYLGFERPFDLTKKAFNNEVPCYFDADKGTIRFVKAEIDNWVEIQNRFMLEGTLYEVHEDRLNDKEIEIGNLKRKRIKKLKITDSSVFA